MAGLRRLLERPAGADPGRFGELWFAPAAERLLCRTVLYAGGRPFFPAEAEFYLHSADHPDPYAHRDPVQLRAGRWYFHRSAGTYRGGSFKGLDLTFGDGRSHAGILLRGAESADGELIDGPSLLVDRLLREAGRATVAELDAAVGARAAWDESGPLRLAEAGEARGGPLVTSARVGLTLRRAARFPEMVGYVGRRYRFLRLPRRTAKGRPLLLIALVEEGRTFEEAAALAGAGVGAARRWASAYRAGAAEPVESFFGAELSAEGLCRMHGAAAARVSPTGT